MVEVESGHTNAALNPTLQSIHDNMLEGLGQLADYFGFSKVIGQLYGTLMLSSVPLSLDDMVERLDISKASVSMNIRTLEHIGMVRQVWVRGKGGRRKYYEAETDYWQIVTNLLAGREMRDVDRAITVMEENTTHLAEALNTMSETDKELARVYMERISHLQLLFQFAKLMITSVLGQAEKGDFPDIPGVYPS